MPARFVRQAVLLCLLLRAQFRRRARHRDAFRLRALAAGVLPGEHLEPENDLAQQMLTIGERQPSAGLGPQRTPRREVCDVVADLARRPGGLGAAAGKESQTVAGLQGGPQGALVF